MVKYIEIIPDTILTLNREGGLSAAGIIGKADARKLMDKKRTAAQLENNTMISMRKGCVLFSLIGFTFFFCCFTGYRLAEEGNIIWTAKYTLSLLVQCLAAGILAGSVLCMVIYYAVAHSDGSRGKAGSVRLPGPAICFLAAWLLIFLAWLPGFLAYYPAVCSYDITVQTGQIAAHAYNDHHPLAHTLLLEGFMKLGAEVFGDTNAGIAAYALAQMAFLASAFAAGIAMLRSWRAKWPWLVLLLLYSMFFPFHRYMSISVTKDTVFSAWMLLQLFCLTGVVRKGANSFKPGKWDIGFGVSTVGMILFRSNGRYALLVLLVFLAVSSLMGRKNRRLFTRLLINGVLGFLVGSMLLSGLFKLTCAQQGDRREMLSMPIQQLARCMVYHGGVGVLPEDDNTMSEEHKALINDFILDEAYKAYRPDISDPVKSHTNTYVVRYRMKDFVSAYLELFLKYPGDYLNAVLAVNAGYLYPGDTSHAYINVNGRDSGLGYIQTRWVEEELNPRGIYKDSKWEWLHGRMEKYADENAYLNTPVIRYLLVPGTYLWLYLVLACYLVIRKRFRLLLPLTLVLGYYVTLFLGPTVQMRYLYPVMCALPFLFAMFICGGSPGEGAGVLAGEERCRELQ